MILPWWGKGAPTPAEQRSETSSVGPSSFCFAPSPSGRRHEDVFLFYRQGNRLNAVLSAWPWSVLTRVRDFLEMGLETPVKPADARPELRSHEVPSFSPFPQPLFRARIRNPEQFRAESYSSHSPVVCSWPPECHSFRTAKQSKFKKKTKKQQ